MIELDDGVVGPKYEADLVAKDYLAGMIHFAKLRSTLLAEYGV